MTAKLTFTGCYDLADVEESFVLSITRAERDDPNRLKTLINRSYRVCLRLRTLDKVLICSLEARQKWIVLRGFGTATASGDVAWPFIRRIPPVGGSRLAYTGPEDKSSVR